jgi:osmotically-inducible protein OsmY
MTITQAAVEADSQAELNMRSDAAIEQDIWSRLWQEDTIRSLDFNNILVEVENGHVLIWGHVRKDFHRRRIEEIIASVPGVSAISNCIVSDHELAVNIAQALSRDEHTRTYFLNVSANHGWVTLMGEVPTIDAFEAVEEVLSSVPGIRGIVDLALVSGMPDPETRPAVQPDMGARVYDWAGLGGRVTGVVINPVDRLVTHFVVRTTGEAAGQRISTQYVLPVATIEVINDENIILTKDVQRISVYPELDLEEFPLAPEDWKPPFPYKPGQVHWRAY